MIAENRKTESSSIRLAVLTGLFAAVSAALGFALMAIPNLELITASIFISGMLLGPVRGIFVGILAELIFASLNPMGMSFPPLMAAQLLTMGLTGFVGGLMGGNLMKWSKWQGIVITGLVGFLLTLNFDFWTTMSFPLSAGMERTQIITTLKLGIPFAIPHLLGNTLIFAVLIPLSYPRLAIMRLKFAPVLIIMGFLISIPGQSFAVESGSETDSLAVIPDSKTLRADSLLYQPIYISPSDSWFDIYHEDMGDIIGCLPGFYLYDLALLGQPLYFQGASGMSQALLYGLPYKSHYYGLTDYNLLSPGYIDIFEYYPASFNGAISADGVLVFNSHPTFANIPYSRVNYRDGLYGMGIADFVFSQKLRQNFGFQIGGRISEFNGRLANSKHDGTTIRGLLHWENMKNTKVDFIYLTTQNKTEITCTTDRRHLVRSDFYLIGERGWGKSPLHIAAHAQLMEEDYHTKSDPSEIGYDFKAWRDFRFGKVTIRPSQLVSWYKMKSGENYTYELLESSTALDAAIPLSRKFEFLSGMKLTVGGDILPSGTVGGKWNWNGDSFTLLSLIRTTRAPAPYHRADYAEASDLFLPGSQIWALDPEAQIQGSFDLEPEEVNAVKLSNRLKFGKLIEFRPELYHKILRNPVELYPLDGSQVYGWRNGGETYHSGAGTELILGRWRGFRLKLSWTCNRPEHKGNFIPENWGYCWFDYQKRAFSDQLLYTISLHGRYIGIREGEYSGNYWALGEENIWGVRVSFRVGDLSLYYGNENLFGKEYEIIPGYFMMHREEVWGINWIFWD